MLVLSQIEYELIAFNEDTDCALSELEAIFDAADDTD